MKVITDFGYTPIFTDTTTGEKTDIGRYGVWEVNRTWAKDEVVATGNDLGALQEEHGPGLTVYPIGPQESGSLFEGSA